MNNKPLEEFLAAVESPLFDVPQPRRAEFLSEIRAHLLASVEAKRADGLNEETAWKRATEEFGEPGEIGRALWKQWVHSGQLETQGEPLSKGQLTRIFVLRLAAAIGIYGLMLLLLSSNHWWRVPFLAVFCTLCFGVGICRARRGGMRWTPVNRLGAVFCVSSLLLALAQLQWAEFSGQPMLFLLANSILLAFGVLWFCLYRRELRHRPWKTFALYKQNAVAAEQAYRLSPMFGWTAGSVFGFIGTLTTFVPLWGWTHALGFCAVETGISVAVGWWLYRSK